MIVKTNAIVLLSRNLRETSKFITIYTEAFGKLTVVAKGVRQKKSKLAGVLEPFNIISVVLYKKENREVHYISSAEIVEPMWQLTTNYDALFAAFGIAELTDVTMHGEEKNPGMYVLLADALRLLAGGVNSAFVFLLFQIRLITLLGYGLVVQECVRCGKSLAGAEQLYFHITEGGFLCSDCARALNMGTKISPSAYNFLASLMEYMSGISTIAGIPVPPDEARNTEVAELRGLLNAYIMYHSESKRALRSASLMSVKG
ncbi:MAG TPA: DNA repair protein RecO [Candidatus Kapabacteria bacterium]|nr:DNA repair protein RecO [Candidatus Kapabacteria bacterium]